MKSDVHFFFASELKFAIKHCCATLSICILLTVHVIQHYTRLIVAFTLQQ